jgi:succinate dehydrogenase / fumarate reductase iron-sulfur subunit
MEKQAIFRLWRGDASGGAFVDYTVDVDEGMVVIDVVHKIQGTKAHDLAVRWNCKAGKCGSCTAEINGTAMLMCMTRLIDLPLNKPVTVRPMQTFPIIKDLITDVSWNYEIKKQIQPFKPATDGGAGTTWNTKQYDVDRVQEFRKCIECFCCQDTCHVLRQHQLFDSFIGPRFLMYTAALEMHPFDKGNRIADLKNACGIGYCNIGKCCTAVCPEEIKITDNAIIPMKERVADRFYDPVQWLWRSFKKLFSNSKTE